ncbi:MAG: V-type ATP synthase subunit D [Candidatus Omnitrophota bacterium]|nr:V-type ATP synthase subunit D [Candidatus Omnitrophota bacterium]
MGKVKLTKGELKGQRDALRRYERYLPILQLKKQQLQIEILHHVALVEDRRHKADAKRREIEAWAGLLAEKGINLKEWLTPKKKIAGVKNIAGVDIPVFDRVEFEVPEYDLFVTPLWVDNAIEALEGLVSLLEEIRALEEGIRILRAELRITTQRVNLFEKVKIPEAEDIIRIIKVYLGDQMANAVGRSKIAKRKIEEVEMAAV